MNHIFYIMDYMFDNFIHTWPYLLITIPIAVGVNLSGINSHINRYFGARPVIAIFLSAFLGAFSPLCSSSVIPVVASLLIGGIPLAPVMSFWLASPSMDPEMFFLTVSALGWELAIWRLAAALALSLGGGFITLFFVQRQWLGAKILRDDRSTHTKTIRELVKQFWQFVNAKPRNSLASCQEAVCVTVGGSVITLPRQQLYELERSNFGYVSKKDLLGDESRKTTPNEFCQASESLFWKCLVIETWAAVKMVVKFMLLAWFLGALLNLYLPENWIASTLGSDKSWAIITAAFLGIPIYTSNLTVMPLVGGLLAQGMHPGAALAFLISGPVTTLPAMSAIWGLVNRKVFGLYIGFSLVGAVILGYLYSFTL